MGLVGKTSQQWRSNTSTSGCCSIPLSAFPGDQEGQRARGFPTDVDDDWSTHLKTSYESCAPWPWSDQAWGYGPRGIGAAYGFKVDAVEECDLGWAMYVSEK